MALFRSLILISPNCKRVTDGVESLRIKHDGGLVAVDNWSSPDPDALGAGLGGVPDIKPIHAVEESIGEERFPGSLRTCNADDHDLVTLPFCLTVLRRSLEPRRLL